MTIKDQIFGAVFETLFENHYYHNFQGVFGLGFTNPASPDKSPLDQVKEEHLINDRVFCFNFDGEMSGGSCELIIGGCDIPAQHYENLTNLANWEIEMPLIEIIRTDKSRIKIDSETGSHAVFNTGASMTHGPKDGINAINQHLGAVWDDDQRLFKLNNCDENILPDIEFTFGEKFHINLKPSDYIIRDEWFDASGVSNPVHFKLIFIFFFTRFLCCFIHFSIGKGIRLF